MGNTQCTYDIFLSYSREQLTFAEGLVRELRNRRIKGRMLRVFWDQDLLGGDNWRLHLSKAIYSSRFLLAVFSEDYLHSETGQWECVLAAIEDPLNRDRKVIPLLYSAEPPKALGLSHVQWIDFREATQPGNPAFKAAVARLLRALRTKKQNQPSGAGKTISGRKLLHAVPLDPAFVGRKKEFAEIDEAWNASHVHAVSIIGWGGFGKSVLARHWIEGMSARGPRTRQPNRVFWWSFYRNASLDAFVEVALPFFSGSRDAARTGSLDARFDQLLTALGQQRSILVLDGLEEMQHGQEGDYFGLCRDYLLGCLLNRICEGEAGETFCVLTSRLPVTDLRSFAGGDHHIIDLEQRPLTAVDSRLLLRNHGVRGTDEQLDEICTDHGYHPLALATLATLLARYFNGDAKRIGDMPALSAPKGGLTDKYKLRRTLTWYLSLLTPAEVALLRAVSVFRRGAPRASLSSLLADLAAKLQILPEESAASSDFALRALCAHLEQLRLLRHDRDTDVYTMHPLPKDFFEGTTPRRLRRQMHEMLFVALCSEAPANPDTLVGMAPLIEAVYHGCRCGRAVEALQVFRERIERKEGYLTKVLCAWDAKVEMCSLFFSGRRFGGSCFLESPEQRGHLLNAAGFAHMNLGQPQKALPLFDRALEAYRPGRFDGDSGQVLRNKSDSFLRMGELLLAKGSAEESLKLDASSKSQQSGLGYLGYSCALLGDSAGAVESFDRACALFGREWLPPVRGVQHVESLVMMGKMDEALTRALAMLKWTQEQDVIFSLAECHRVLGLLYRELALRDGSSQRATESQSEMQEACDLAVRAAVHFYTIRTIVEDIQTRLLLAVANLCTLKDDKEALARRIREVAQTCRASSYKVLLGEVKIAEGILARVQEEHGHGDVLIQEAAEIAADTRCRWLKERCDRLLSTDG